MAFGVDDLLVPKGRVEPSFFPSDDEAALESRLAGYLFEATGKIPDEFDGDPDKYLEAWALHRVYASMADRLSSTPAQVDLNDQGSRSYLREQITYYQKLAAEWLLKAEAILSPPEATTQGPNANYGSVPTQIEWW